jgi:hypothetical protein
MNRLLNRLLIFLYLLPVPFDADDLRLAWYNSWAATRGRAGIDYNPQAGMVLWRDWFKPGDVVLFQPDATKHRA